MSGKKGQKRRLWSDDEKLLICAQARVPGVSVAQVARRYAMNTNLIHTWLRDPQFAPEAEPPVDAKKQGSTFFPIEVTGVASPPALSTALTAQRVDITLSDGRRILVEGATALAAIVAMVEAVAQ